MWSAGRTLVHAFECFLHVAGGAIGQARNDRSSRKYFWVASKHDGSHSASRGESADEYPIPIDAKIGNALSDHLPNRDGLSSIAPTVLGQEPIKTSVWIVGALLLRQKQCEPVTLSERRPAAAEIVPSGTLCASMQDNH
jgi:hypothetical protein